MTLSMAHATPTRLNGRIDLRTE